MFRVHIDIPCFVALRSGTSLTAFTPRQPASSVERLANQRLHLGRNEVSDWIDAQHSTLTALVCSALGQMRDADQALGPLIAASPKLPSYRVVQMPIVRC
ncbi:hypothetical protein TNCV_3348271 [Trichonephila clavipes]|nr:hypothetical protein TNCV_3348271 [Trichonephila clavipes]